MNNIDSIVKDALGTSDFKTAGGYLNAEQSTKFLRGVIDQPTIMKAARTVIIDGENKKIEKIGFGQRIMRPGSENTALTSEQYSKPTFGKVELTTHEAIAEVRLSYDTLEANIEGQNLKNTIMTMIQERVALDLEELIMNGDTDLKSTDPYLGIADGVLKKANSHIVDNLGAQISTDAWTKLIKAVPSKYRRVPSQYRIYTSDAIDLAWKEAIASRNTVAGDRFLLESVNATALGYTINPIAMIKDELSYGDATPVTGLGQALLVHPQNIVVGFTRKVQVETDKDISARQLIIVVTVKLDVAIEEADATAKLINILPTISLA